MLRLSAVIVVAGMVVPPGGTTLAQEMIAVTVPNHGGAMEGHTPRGFRGMGTGLFAGDNLNPSFPDGDGVHFFLTFDLSGVPAGGLARAELRSDHLKVVGDPFGDLGPLRVESIRYSRFSPDLWDKETIAEACVLTDLAAPTVACEVTAAVAQAIEAGADKAQFRLRLDQAGDSDGEPDLAMFFISGSNVNEAGIFTLELTLAPGT